MKILVRYDLPVFSSSSVLAYFGRKGLPKGFRQPLGWEDVRRLKEIRQPLPKSRGNAYDLFSTLSLDFEHTPYGLYLTDEGRSISDVAVRRQYKDLGKFTSEGLSNHIHLRGLSGNPVTQFEIGVRAIRAWAPAIREISKLKKVVLYLHSDGRMPSRDFTLCVYSNPRTVEIQTLEKDWSINMLELDVTTFLNWAIR